MFSFSFGVKFPTLDPTLLRGWDGKKKTEGN